MYKIEFYPYPKNANISEIKVWLELSKEDLASFKKMKKSQRENYVKLNATVSVTDFSCDYEVPNFNEMSISKIKTDDNVDYKAKYEKCIKVLKKYDAGIIGMYDL